MLVARIKDSTPSLKPDPFAKSASGAVKSSFAFADFVGRAPRWRKSFRTRSRWGRNAGKRKVAPSRSEILWIGLSCLVMQPAPKHRRRRHPQSSSFRPPSCPMINPTQAVLLNEPQDELVDDTRLYCLTPLPLHCPFVPGPHPRRTEIITSTSGCGSFGVQGEQAGEELRP